MTFYAEDFKALERKEERKIEEDYAIFRLDGSNFSLFTKQFEKPFSDVFEKAMDESARAAKSIFPNALLTYVGSDEISILVTTKTQLPYGGRINKLLSLTAAHATAGFVNSVENLIGIPAFDSRFVQFSDAPENMIEDYFTWRRLDMRKNAVSMAVSHLHSHKSLLGVSTRDRITMLEGTPFEKISESIFNGRFIIDDETIIATRETTDEILKEVFQNKTYLGIKE